MDKKLKEKKLNVFCVEIYIMKNVHNQKQATIFVKIAFFENINVIQTNYEKVFLKKLTKKY